MKTLRVNTGKGYDIYIENNIRLRAGAYLRACSDAKKVCLVSDSHVSPLYGEEIVSQLTAQGTEVCSFVFPAGETSKTPATLISLLEYLAQNELTRGDLILALGGGVTGDLAGLAAALYLRGIDYVQLPTSLLSQVDASVGGKTAVDLPQGKNLCGAFYPPRLVLIDPMTLTTLPKEDIRSGMAEMIKMGCIQSPALLELLEAQTERWEDIIFEAVRLKAAIVERDEYDTGVRNLLNFGHTMGHAIEKIEGFAGISHGAAVGLGMVYMTRAAEKNGLTKPGTADEIARLLERCGLPTKADYALDDILTAMRADKKRTKDGYRLVLLHKVGDGYLYDLREDALPAFLEGMRHA